MTRLRILLALCLVLLMTLVQAQNLVAVPPLKARVTDSVGLLKPDQRAALENTLTEYETRSGSQIAVLLIASTSPEAIEQYSIRVFDAWKLGRKGTDDGVLLVVAKDNPKVLRRLRIEAGRGVQGVLTDAQSKRVLQDVIAPYFAKEDYYGGLVAGVSAISVLLDKEQFAAPVTQAGNRQAADNSGLMGSLPLLLFGAFILITLISRARGGRGRAHGNAWGNAVGVILGSAMSGGFGRSGGGGGFGGGGFSGGGGSADGGGASGDW